MKTQIAMHTLCVAKSKCVFRKAQKEWSPNLKEHPIHYCL